MAPFAQLNMPLNGSRIIFNEITDNALVVSDVMFLVAKMHIYKMRGLGKKPIKKSQVYAIRNHEKYFATTNNKLDQFIFKWYNVKESRLEFAMRDSYVSEYIDAM